ncbi:bacteriophage T4 gp5 trimerisation domain-containing protein [Pseudoalteromonas umbrosa]|uniref:bacteriophage T4 gp5 trimerisation domain-containing protein n=1 Tax=Pseudoalteromonas umbrosa TaxID=3048489 RepID=UPI0024C26AFB|nr:hypothetical protein [Pseudoalteromonas sp. B95]MDK1290217.1 hypothetical protein [Pseudoalteromonas sp. B95]
MAHENRQLHRRDVESGVIDNNPYPADLKPHKLEIDSSLDMMTKPVLNEEDGDDVYASERTLKYPSYSIHGKSGNFTADQDGTFRFVGCTLNTLEVESICTIILVNSSVRHLSGDALEDADNNTTGQARIILIDSNLERVEDLENFYLSLHGLSAWNGNLSDCKKGVIRLQQSKDWIAENNIDNCEDLRFSIALTGGCKVRAVGDYFAHRSDRLRFQWHHTPLVMTQSSAVTFDECTEVLTQHHNSDITATEKFAYDAKHIAVILHSSILSFETWLFDEVERPVLSATHSQVNATSDTGGLLNDPVQSRIHLGNQSSCEAANLIMGEDGVLSLHRAKVKTAGPLGDAQKATIRLVESSLTCEDGGAAIKLQNCNFKSINSTLKSDGICLDAQNSVIDIEQGSFEGKTSVMRLTKCSTTLKLLTATSDSVDLHAIEGSLTIEGGSLAKSLQGAQCGHIRLSDVVIGGDINLNEVSAMELYGTQTDGNLSVTGGHFQSGGNHFGGSGNVKTGISTLGGDSFDGSLKVTGISMVGEVNASDTTNVGFMLVEGGSGSSHLPNTNRGWHVTESMDWVIDNDVWINVGANTDWKIGQNLTSDVGIDMSYTVGGNASYQISQNLTQDAGMNVDVNAGSNLTTNAGSVNTVQAGSMVVISAPTIAEN